MILLVGALYREAAPLIQALSLKRDPACTAFQRFAGEDAVLYLSGTGESAAACCAGFALGREENVSHLVNLGAAAGPAGTKGRLFRILSLEDQGSGKRFYPDLLLSADIPEAALVTSPRPVGREEVRLANQNVPHPVLFDMEGAALFAAAGRFLGPERIHLFKFVSDDGTEGALTPELLSSLAEEAAPKVLSFIRNLPEKREDAASPVSEKELEETAALFCCSAAMRRRLYQILLWCHLSGEDPTGEIAKRKEAGELPAKDRREGKKVLDAVERSLIGG
ncbi:MAG: hypothetical protein ACI4OJ_07390 [Lachnospiraceae bacterium]